MCRPETWTNVGLHQRGYLPNLAVGCDKFQRNLVFAMQPLFSPRLQLAPTQETIV